MFSRTFAVSAAGASLLAAIAGGNLAGCKNLPGGPKEQGAVIGGAGGAVAGAAIAKDKPLLGALIGGVVGAGGGYLIGANWDKIKGNDKHSAEQAVSKSQNAPATAQEARQASNADINNDGFVTLDEVAAMQKAGFSDDEMIRRLEATGQVFDLSPANEQQLRDYGVNQRVINAMRSMNRQGTYAPSDNNIIGRPR